jgi:hypothetical protein
MNLSFQSEEIKQLQEKYPEAWFFINLLRLERENKELRDYIASLKPKE